MAPDVSRETREGGETAHHTLLNRVASWAGISVRPEGPALLERYVAWLQTEALPAGALGPAEAPRLWERHIADSITFAGAWRGRSPTRLLDVGSGAGLPGLPLAVLLPDVEVVLLERSGRRAALLRRAVRVLRLENAAVQQGTVDRVAGRADAVTFRGVMAPVQAFRRAVTLLEKQGVAVVGWRRSPAVGSEDVPSPPPGWAVDVVAVPAEVLDSAPRLLRMRAAGPPRSGPAD